MLSKVPKDPRMERNTKYQSRKLTSCENVATKIDEKLQELNSWEPADEGWIEKISVKEASKLAETRRKNMKRCLKILRYAKCRRRVVKEEPYQRRP